MQESGDIHSEMMDNEQSFIFERIAVGQFNCCRGAIDA